LLLPPPRESYKKAPIIDTNAPLVHEFEIVLVVGISGAASPAMAYAMA
jgi:hypothetical protein